MVKKKKINKPTLSARVTVLEYKCEHIQKIMSDTNLLLSQIILSQVDIKHTLNKFIKSRI